MAKGHWFAVCNAVVVESGAGLFGCRFPGKHRIQARSRVHGVTWLMLATVPSLLSLVLAPSAVPHSALRPARTALLHPVPPVCLMVFILPRKPKLRCILSMASLMSSMCESDV